MSDPSVAQTAYQSSRRGPRTDGSQRRLRERGQAGPSSSVDEPRIIQAAGLRPLEIMSKEHIPTTSDPRGTSSDHTSPDPYTSGSFLSLDEPNTPVSDSSFSQDHSDQEGRPAGDGRDAHLWDPGFARHHPYADASVYAYPDSQQQSRDDPSSSAAFSISQSRRKAEERGMMDAERSYRRTAGGGDEMGIDTGASAPDEERQKSTRGTKVGQQMGRKASTGVLASPPTALMGGLGLDFGSEASTGPTLPETDDYSSAAMLSRENDLSGTSEEMLSSRSRGEPQRPSDLGRERRRGASDSRTPTLRTVKSERRPLSLFTHSAEDPHHNQATAPSVNGQTREVSGPSAAGPSAAKPGRLSRLYYNPPDGPSVSGLSAAIDKRISSQNQHSDPSGRRLAFGYRAPSHSPGPTATRGGVDEPKRSVSAMGAYDHFLDRDGLARNGAAGAKELILPSITATKRLTLREEAPVNSEDANRSAEAPRTIGKISGAAPALRKASSQILKGRPGLANTGSAQTRSPDSANVHRSGERPDLDGSMTTKARTVDASGGRTATRLKRESGHPNSTDADPTSPTSPTSPRRADTLTDTQIVEMGAIGDQAPASLLPSDGSPLSSKNVLTIALAKAQSAVTFDSNNEVPEAVEAYGQAGRLLQEVMQRITPKPGSSKKSNREDERRRLKVIHDTYTERIRLLTMLYESEGEEPADQTEPADESLEVMPSRSSAIPEGGRLPGEGAQGEQVIKASRQREHLPIARSDSSSARDTASSAQSHPRTPLATDTQGALAGPVQFGLYQAQQRSDTNSSYRSMTSGPSSGPLNSRTKLTDPPSIRHPSSEDAPATPYFDADSSPAGGQHPPSPMLATPDRFAQGHLAPGDALSHRGRAGASGSASPHLDASTGQALPSPRSPSSPHGEASWPAFGPHMLTADSMDSRSRSFESVSSQSSQRPRAATVASSSARAAAEDAVKQTLLVHSTTKNGTIRQRRQSPSIGGDNSEGRDDVAGSPRTSDEQSVASAAAMRAELSAQRRRALSQPGNRPGLNGTGSYQGTAPTQAPPLPRLKNGRSLPGPIVTMNGQGGLAPPNGDATSTSGQSRQSFRMPSPGLSSPSVYHAMMERGVSASPELTTAQATDPSWASPYPASVGGDVMAELFPSSLASSQALGSASYTLSQITACPRLRVAAPSLLQDFCEPLALQPQNAALAPYRSVKAMDTSISKGGFVTPKLCVPSALWQASGLRLTALETKVRLIEIVTNGIDAVEKSGAYLLHNSPGVRQPGLAAVQASAFAKQLEDFEVLLVEVQNGLAKKLGISEFAAGTAGKKGGSSFNVLSSKLTRSIDRFAQQTTSGKNLDSPAAYVDSLQRLFKKAKILEAHLAGLLQSKSTSSSPTSATASVTIEADTVEAYAALPPEIQRVVEAKLLRASEFFAQVIVKIVARDLHVMVEKSLKRASTALVE